jgi:hypothetical protein
MNKDFMKWFKWVVLLVAVGFLVWFLLLPKSEPQALAACCKWTEWQDVTKCVAPCDSTGGVKTQERYCQKEECEYSCPVIEWKWRGKTYDVQYEKSHDPTKCHRPSDSDLKKLGMSNDCVGAFKRDHKEWKDADRKCKLVTLETESREIKCEAELVPCEPTVTPTPEPTLTPEPQRGTTEAGTPQCNDHTPLVLPSNVHVIRNGSDATVNFFSQSSNANIYYRTSGQSVWQHALRDIPVTGGYVSVTIHDLVPTGDYDFGVQSANSCAGGEVVLAVVEDDWQPRTFGFSWYEWLR